MIKLQKHYARRTQNCSIHGNEFNFENGFIDATIFLCSYKCYGIKMILCDELRVVRVLCCQAKYKLEVAPNERQVLLELNNESDINLVSLFFPLYLFEIVSVEA